MKPKTVVEPDERLLTLAVRNTGTKELTFALELWGREYSILPGDALQVAWWGPLGGLLEVETGDDRLTVYGWPGSDIRVFRDGKEL
jgi:hypothetical protein